MEALKAKFEAHEDNSERDFERIEEHLGKHDETLEEIGVTLENHSCRLTAAETGIKTNNALIWKVIAAIMAALAGTQALAKFTGGLF